MTLALLLTIAAIFVLLCLSALFSGSETAVTAASRSRMHFLENEGNRRAALVTWLIARREALIGAILLGNNLVNILASALATSLLIGLVGETGIIYATVAMTALVFIFSEVLPKTYALRHADNLALGVSPILKVLVVLLSPITGAVSWFVAGVLKALGRPDDARDALSVAEELRGTIDLHAREGTMRKRYRDMLRSILDLSEVEVGEIMVHRRKMLALDIQRPPAELVRQILQSPYTRIPLWKDNPDNIVGVLHAKDLLRSIQKAGETITNRAIEDAASEPWFVPDTTSLAEQLAAFRERHAHFALVVDEYGALMGLVTLEDILEEIVGDIADEHDRPTSGVQTTSDGSLYVDGSVTIRDLNRAHDWRLPDEEAVTVAGLVINEAKRIPETGEVFALDGLIFEVVDRDDSRIIRLKVEPDANPPQQEPE